MTSNRYTIIIRGDEIDLAFELAVRPNIRLASEPVVNAEVGETRCEVLAAEEALLTWFRDRDLQMPQHFLPGCLMLYSSGEAGRRSFEPTPKEAS